ncbi:hypothetical protein DM860_010402 [Cuscuta australis]|uniref:HhH-GPD domain-containing protein n=1 Tax=Cuscuta australis TaxID=267555 RepID=A0A328E0Z7_9ASTE|nr:hypothetical protein DM860_010402 [Cuscuta australis]
MDSGIGSSFPGAKDLRTDITNAWVPATPAKLHLPELEPINQFNQMLGNGHQPVQPNLANFCNNQRNASVIGGVSPGIDRLEASVSSNSTVQNLLLGENEDFGSMSFQSLLALAENPNTHNALNLPFNSQNTDGSSSCSRTSFNLNFPPMRDADSSSNNSSFRFAPITPAKNIGTEEMLNLSLSINEIQASSGIEETVKESKLHEKEELSVLLKEVSDLVENHKPDKEGELGTDIINNDNNNNNKTPQQKPRRKRHRPKVVIEGKARRRYAPRTPNATPGTGEGAKTKKRKYVQRNGVDRVAATPSDEGSNVIDPEKRPNDTPTVRRRGPKGNPGHVATPSLEGSIVIDLEKMSPDSNKTPKVRGRRPKRNQGPAATTTDECSNVIDHEKMATGSDETLKVRGRRPKRNQKPAATPTDEGLNIIDLENLSTGSDKTPKVVRRRGKRNQRLAAEDGSNVIDLEKIPPSSNETPKVNRNYSRINQGCKSHKNCIEESSESTQPEAVSSPRGSCKKALEFEHEEYEDFPEPSPSFGNSNVRRICKLSGKSIPVIEQEWSQGAELTELDITTQLPNIMNDENRKFLSQQGTQVLDPLTPSKMDTSYDKLMDGSPVRGKCKITFSDTTHYIYKNMTEMKRNIGTQCVTGSQNNSSNFSFNALLTEKTTVRGSKRQHPCSTEAKLHSTNGAGIYGNSLQAYRHALPLGGYNIDRYSGMHFPIIDKKKRSENVCIPATSCSKNLTTDPYHMIRACQFGDNGSLSNNAAYGAQSLRHHLPLSIDMSERKRPKGLSRVRDVVPSHQIYNQFTTSSTETAAKQQMTVFDKSMGTLVADAHPAMATKTHLKRNSFNGHLHAMALRDISPIDKIAERLRHLNINDDCQVRYALGNNNSKSQRETALVLYQRDGTIAPFVEVKKRRRRPKVDLDDETTRVWKLLLQDINSQGIDGTDEEKEKWWEEERKVFRGRADSFIARMRLVQGDRRFSPWKGSVVDSVVGVFLTQNVSDHLSSSAFMSLAARFPPKSSTSAQFCEERTNVIVEEPVCVMDPDDTIAWHEGPSNKPNSGKGSVTFKEMGWNEEVINSELTEDTSTCIKSAENSEDKCFYSFEKDPDVYHGLTLGRPSSWMNKEEVSAHSSQTETDIVLSSQNSGVFSHNSVDSSHVQTVDRIETISSYTGPFSQLLELASTKKLHEYHQENRSANMDVLNQDMGFQKNKEDDTGSIDTIASCSTADFPLKANMETPGVSFFGPPRDGDKLNGHTREHCALEQSSSSTKLPNQATNQKILPEENDKVCNSHQIGMNVRIDKDPIVDLQERNCDLLLNQECPTSLEIPDITERVNTVYSQSNSPGQDKHLDTIDRTNSKTSKGKGGKPRREKEVEINWDLLREEAQSSGKKRERTWNTMDSLDWEAVRCANVHEIAETIKERGMNNMLAERIQEFLNRLVKEHGSTDLEWLRDVPPDKAKEYLLSFRGLGLKSVECVRLLTLHHLAFPVDTNVGRIAVRLGWVPLQPLPESLQLHLLELYPILESIQKYLWPRLCKLDQGTLYELHYHMITFGKVFCTKSKPNCNACPLRGECRHFASAFASARLALPAPEEKRIVNMCENIHAQQNPKESTNLLQLPFPESNPQSVSHYAVSNSQPIIEEPSTPEPVIEIPATPVQEQIPSEPDIEDAYNDDSNEIPTINLNLIQFAQNVKMYVQNNMELNHVEMSNALVALTPEAASIPMPKLKNISRLRTEHHVYELPDNHPLLCGLEKRDPDDPCSYLLAIWTPGETASSIQPPERLCDSQDLGKLCHEETCFACNSIREAQSQTVRGTILIPCRTAMRGSFPLNGTYFQVNEVFADHESSLQPIDVPRTWLWDLHRKTVFFGTSIPTIFKGLSTEDIQHCFWKGYVCVRGFERKTRAPRPLMARLHFPASKMAKTKTSTDEA